MIDTAVRTDDLGLVRVLGVLALVPAARALADPDAGRVVAALCGLLAVTLHLVALSGHRVVASPAAAGGLVACTLLAGVVAHASGGQSWVLVAVVAALQAAVRLEPLPAAAAAIAVCAATALATGPTDGAVATVLIVAGPGLIAALRHRLLVTIAELHATRDRLAEVAVRRERDRFSDDLHDLLGHSLSVMVVSAQVVQKVAGAHPEQAAAAGAEIEGVGRQALDDVRAAVLGYRARSFTAELETLAQALRAAGIEPGYDLRVDPPEPLESALSLVVREAVTNVIRHAHASRCRVCLNTDDTHLVLLVTDDGAGDAAAAARATAGLATVRARVAEYGGHVAVEPAEPHGLSVRVVVPTGVTP